MSQSSGSVWTPTASQDNASEISACNLKRKALDQFLTICDASPIKKTLTANWEDCSDRTKKDYILKTKKILSEVIDVLAPGQGHYLLEALANKDNDSQQNHLLLDEITAAYTSTNDWGTQRQILSLVASKIPYQQLKLSIPNLSRYKYSAARKHALSVGEGQQVPKSHLNRECITDAQVSHFLDFVMSPAIITDMPFGETKLKLSNGETVNVPKVILNSVRTRVIDQYFSYCAESGFDTTASISTYMRMLQAIGPNVRKCMKGLDNYAADGAKGFESLQKVVTLLGRLGKGKEWEESNTKLLSTSKQYLKVEYKVNMKNSMLATKFVFFFVI